MINSSRVDTPQFKQSRYTDQARVDTPMFQFNMSIDILPHIDQKSKSFPTLFPVSSYFPDQNIKRDYECGIDLDVIAYRCNNEMNPAERMVLKALVALSNKYGVIRASRARIASMGGVSPRSVTRAFKILKSWNYIRSYPMFGGIPLTAVASEFTTATFSGIEYEISFSKSFGADIKEEFIYNYVTLRDFKKDQKKTGMGNVSAISFSKPFRKADNQEVSIMSRADIPGYISDITELDLKHIDKVQLSSYPETVVSYVRKELAKQTGIENRIGWFMVACKKAFERFKNTGSPELRSKSYDGYGYGYGNKIDEKPAPKYPYSEWKPEVRKPKELTEQEREAALESVKKIKDPFLRELLLKQHTDKVFA